MPSSRPFIARFSRLAVLISTLAVTFSVAQGSAFAAGSTHSKSAAAKTHRKETAASKAHDSGSGPAEGIFDNCDIHVDLTTCEQRLQVMANGGLQVVVVGNLGDATEQDFQSFASAARADGMSVMWELNDAGFWGGTWDDSSAAYDFSTFATACGCTSTSGVLEAMISFLGGLPGTYGYYAADDSTLHTGESAALRSYVNQIKAADPNHMVMIGANAGQGQSNAGSGAVLGNEIYPVLDQNIANQGNNLAAWDEVQQQITQAQNSATKHNQPSAFILQAFTFGDSLSDGEAVGSCTASMTEEQCYHKLLYPSAQVQTELRNEVLEHSHAKLILWYSFQGTYGQAGNDTSSIYPTGALAHARWSGLTDAISAPLPDATATAARAQNAKAKAKTHKSSAKKTRKVKKTAKRS